MTVHAPATPACGGRGSSRGSRGAIEIARHEKRVAARAARAADERADRGARRRAPAATSQRELERARPAARCARAAEAAGLAAVCRHDAAYPARLRDLPRRARRAVRRRGADPVGGSRASRRPDAPTAAVAIVGARRASPYGLEVARALGARARRRRRHGRQRDGARASTAPRTPARSTAGAATVAVLAGGADVPYPASKRALYRRIVDAAAASSPRCRPGSRRSAGAFPARNRIIAALGAHDRRGRGRRALGLADHRRGRRRPRARRRRRARAGDVVARAGTNALLHDGAALVRDAADVLDVVVGARPRRRAPTRRRGLEPRLASLLRAGRRRARHARRARRRPRPGAGARSRRSPSSSCSGRLRRVPGGRYVVVPRW